MGKSRATFLAEVPPLEMSPWGDECEDHGQTNKECWQYNLTHQPLLVTLGVMEPLDGERCDVFHCQPPARDPRHGLARVALPRQHLLIHILRGNLGVCFL